MTGTAGTVGRVPFGTRLAAAMESVGPLCLGIDPHPLRGHGRPGASAGRGP